MKLNEATYFPDAKELTRHGFVSHMEDFIGKLLGDNPLGADVDDYLKDFGFDAPKALEVLTKPEIDDVPESAVVIRQERIKSGGKDENGKPMKDSFQVIYRVPKRDSERGIKGIDEKLRNLYIKMFENHVIEGTILNEDGEGGGDCFVSDMGGNDGSSTFSLGAGDSYPYYDKSFGIVRKQDKIYTPKTEKKKSTNEGKKKMKCPIGRMTMFITEEQMKQLAQLLKEEGEDGGFGGGALTTNNIGADGSYPWYDVPFGTKSKKDPAMDHKNMLSRKNKDNQPTGHDGRKVHESKSGIHIKEKNKGKFTATKKRTGKSTEELTHSKNPITRKRAQFALNASKWNHKK